MFEDSGAKTKGPLDVTAPKDPVKAPPTPADQPKAGPITAKPVEAAPIKTTAFREGAAAFQEQGIGGVVQTDAGARLEGALCELFEDTSALKDRTQEGELRERQLTNSDGLFLFESRALSLAERYLLKVSHPMFVTERKSVDIRRPEVITVVMRPGTGISGTIRSVAGAGLPNATVTVFDLNQNTLDPNGSIETYVTTDNTGFYTLAHLSPGMKKVQASASGYATAGRQGVNVEGGKPLSNVDFTLNEGGGISGQIVSSDGQLVQGAYVTARPVRIGPRPEVDGMGQGAAEIQAKREAAVKSREHALRLQETGGKEPVSGGEDDEEIARKGRDEAKEMMLQKEREAAANKERELQNAPGAAGPAHKKPPFNPPPPPALTTISVRSQADGTYLIAGTEVGSYVVSVNAPGYMPPAQQTVESPTQGVNFILAPNARILGRVVDDETGKPVSMFSIGVTQNPDDVLIPAYSKKPFGPPKSVDGNFEYVDVKPGRIWLLADAAGYAGGRSAEIVIGQGERREGVEIRLVRGSTIKGRVLDAKGGPVANATVQPDPASMASNMANPFIGVLTQSMRRDIREARTDSEGRFAIPNMLSGSYTLSVKHPDYGPQTTPAFTVQGNGETNHPDIVMSRGASIRGRVKLADGTPDTKAMVQVAPVGTTPNFGGHRSAYTDAEGRFEVVGLAVGQYRVIVAQRNGQPDIGSLFKGLAQGGQAAQNIFSLGEGEVKEIDL
jgi:hypothetical protein